MNIDDRIFQYAKSLVDTPYVHQGSNAFVGLDCLQLIIISYKSVGIDIINKLKISKEFAREIREKRYRTLAMNDKMFEVCNNSFKRSDNGLLTICKIGKYHQHVGLCRGEHFIHSDMALGRVVKQKMPTYRKKNMHRFEVR